MGLLSDLYQSWVQNTKLENIRAQRRIDEARRREQGRTAPKKLLDAMGRVPYGRFDLIKDVWKGK
jgi:hypothetical protein